MDPATAEEPSLRAAVAEQWNALPVAGRWGAVLLLLGIAAWIVVPRLLEVSEGPTEEERQQEATTARRQYAEVLRQNPTPLDSAVVDGTLGPGDAEPTDERYVDHYVYEADSVAFSILATSGEFTPDLSVRLPDGRTVAASDLLSTQTRAEVDGLQGPGRFEVVMTSRQARAEGAYELSVLPAGPADSVYVDGDARLDTLGSGPLRGGRYEAAYGISTGSELPVIVRVVSSAFVPRVQLIGPNGEVRDSWRSIEQVSAGDSLGTVNGVVLRYLPGWDAPYRLLVSSEEPGAAGAFAVEVKSIPIRPLRVGETGVSATLGDGSWIEDGRYVDSYRFRIGADVKTTLEVESEDFPPAFRLWRIARRARSDVSEEVNEEAVAEISLEDGLDAGEYFLEVSSGGEDTTVTRGGEYAVRVMTEANEPAPSLDRPALSSKVFATEVRRTGQSGGSTFEVGVTNVAISYPNASRTRVQLSITVRSIDYTGGWAPWASFARQAYVVDDRGRRYTAAVTESQSPSGLEAEPGTARRGTVVFYLPEVAEQIERVVLVASIGERTVTLPIPVPR
ncbi:hypothetical protein [Rubrivirga sp.]|uniref:hypothetical protein n=1 Tax=Rubrivirga sp. TaxID=1885344 RepID=UPI003C78FCCF